MKDIKNMSNIEKAHFKEIINDPVYWAKTFIKVFSPITKKTEPWTARWYQVEMLRDKSLKKVARCGRRTGKCLPEWVTILDPITGDRKTVGEIYKEQRANVATMTDSHKIETTSTDIIFDNGVKEVFRVKLRSGKSIDATGNHPLYTISGWKEIDELKTGDFVATPRSLPYFGKDHMPDYQILLLAYMLGDGNCKGKNLRFSTADEKVRLEMDNVVRNFGCILKQYDSSKYCDFTIVKRNKTNHRGYANQVKEFLVEQDVFDRGAREKKIPDSIFRLNRRQIVLFLSRLFTTDGWASSSTKYKNNAEIGYGSSSKELIDGVQHLLLRFGIRSTVSYKPNVDSYQLIVTNQDGIRTFADEINIYSKEEAVKKVVSVSSSRKRKDDLVPREIMDEVKIKKDLLSIPGTEMESHKWASKNSRFRTCYSVQRKILKHYGEVLNEQRFVDLGESDIYWDEIMSIESIGKYQTYDLTIPNTHNFVANDIIVHNTETMCVDALWRTYTKPKYRCLFVTPYENQCRLIFIRLKELIEGSPLLKKELKRMTQNPYMIEWKSGSMMMGFTTGAASGSGGAGIRGQRADQLYIDEMDYLGENDFDTVSMIAAERDDIGMFCSSTPTGRRSKFYDLCTNKSLNYKEFHFPSTMNPNWGPVMEAEFKGQLSDLGFTHEIMAEFGTQQSGVFDKAKIDLAMTFDSYAYSKLDYFQEQRMKEAGIIPKMHIYERGSKAPMNPFRCVGIDWDKYSASSSIIVLDYDMYSQKFKVIKRVEVPRGEYSYDNAVNMVVEINEIYNPAWIYCDRGSGRKRNSGMCESHDGVSNIRCIG